MVHLKCLSLVFIIGTGFGFMIENVGTHVFHLESGHLLVIILITVVGFGLIFRCPFDKDL